MKIRSVLAALSLGAAALTVPLVSAGPAAAGPAGCTAGEADIYTPPASVSGNPGDILACRETTLWFVPNLKPYKAWKVQYVTTDAKGNRVAASGTVAIPTDAWTQGGPRPTLAYAPFTHGSGSSCSLSKQMTTGFQDQFEAPNLSGYLNEGWALAATDGVGYLDGQTHYYVNGKANGPATLDIARAARRIPGSTLTAGGKVGISGYSEGGNTAGWAAQLAASYAPDLDVAGAASGGIPADLKAAAKQLNGSVFAGFLADTLIGLKAQYPEMPFDQLMNDAGRQVEKDVKNNCLLGTLGVFAGARVENYTTQKLSLDQLYAVQGPGGTTWGQIADSLNLGVDVGGPNSSAKYKVAFPLFLYRGWAEEILPHEPMDRLHATYCQTGVQNTYKIAYPTEHATTMFGAAGDVLNFFRDRFAGKPFQNGC
ncbi:lipase family protein [Actinomadura rupiterrae]|uniref:lipase family protein n=1 Tax=Actinomadura rupiterrae TaxID=559627 RepID=UPI0020A2A4E5|nr:lipase family protein [Actinomadura rupiterrae]MCP2342175.1 triacylglycerol lipase [Actinomadura rupiterrae]